MPSLQPAGRVLMVLYVALLKVKCWAAIVCSEAPSTYAKQTNTVLDGALQAIVTKQTPGIYVRLHRSNPSKFCWRLKGLAKE
jgi:hypothetical protein